MTTPLPAHSTTNPPVTHQRHSRVFLPIKGYKKAKTKYKNGDMCRWLLHDLHHLLNVCLMNYTNNSTHYNCSLFTTKTLFVHLKQLQDIWEVQHRNEYSYLKSRLDWPLNPSPGDTLDPYQIVGKTINSKQTTEGENAKKNWRMESV